MLGHLGAFDDEALRVFLQPGEGGAAPGLLGLAAQGLDTRLAGRLLDALPAEARPAFAKGRATAAPAGEVALAGRTVVNLLFWPLLYWHDPLAYEELVAGERIHPRILDALDLDGRNVCDAGAGAGRFTIFAARRARHVVAVDEVPALLRRLELHLREQCIDNVDVRRGSFTALPLEDDSVDIAVACSSLTSRAPFGGQDALDELERIVRPGGDVAIIWPDRPDWFCDRGFVHLSAAGNDHLHFTDAAAAERICRDFYSDEAADWVARQGTADVPFMVLGVPPPNDVCIRRVPASIG